MSTTVPPAEPDALPPAEKAKQFPAGPGVYLMKDRQGVVLYVGKAKNLRNRAGHYFTRAAAEDPRTADLVKLIADVDFVEADTEVDPDRPLAHAGAVMACAFDPSGRRALTGGQDGTARL